MLLLLHPFCHLCCSWILSLSFPFQKEPFSLEGISDVQGAYYTLPLTRRMSWIESLSFLFFCGGVHSIQGSGWVLITIETVWDGFPVFPPLVLSKHSVPQQMFYKWHVGTGLKLISMLPYVFAKVFLRVNESILCLIAHCTCPPPSVS